MALQISVSLIQAPVRDKALARLEGLGLDGRQPVSAYVAHNAVADTVLVIFVGWANPAETAVCDSG